MKFRLGLGLLTLALAALAASAPAPADSGDDSSLTAAQRATLEKNAAEAAAQAQTAIEKANPKHLPSFPGAEGFGALATGGRGGEVVHVTNLDDSGPGSFRNAVGQPNRVVVFDVGGVIKLKSDVNLSDNLTVLGQTAPGDGICLYGNSVSLTGHSNIILRYLRLRQGISGKRGDKVLGMDKTSNAIVDHCSIEWGRWDDLGITVGSTGITVQNCIVAEGINPQSFGALIDTVTNVSLSHNLWMSNESRNPKAKGTIQYINNVVYNWQITGLCGGHSFADHHLDVIGNYFIKGPSSNNQFAGQFLKTDHVYQRGNFADLDCDGKLNGEPVQDSGFADKSGSPTFVTEAAMHPLIPVTIESADAAYAKIVADAGYSRHRDAVDARLIKELQSLGTQGKTIPRADPAGEAVAGGLGEIKGAPAPVDSDNDGIPDAWETAHGLDPHDPSDAAKLSPSGYANIEVYANSLLTAPATAVTP